MPTMDGDFLTRISRSEITTKIDDGIEPKRRRWKIQRVNNFDGEIRCV